MGRKEDCVRNRNAANVCSVHGLKLAANFSIVVALLKSEKQEKACFLTSWMEEDFSTSLGEIMKQCGMTRGHLSRNWTQCRGKDS